MSVIKRTVCIAFWLVRRCLPSLRKPKVSPRHPAAKAIPPAKAPTPDCTTPTMARRSAATTSSVATERSRNPQRAPQKPGIRDEALNAATITCLAEKPKASPILKALLAVVVLLGLSLVLMIANTRRQDLGLQANSRTEGNYPTSATSLVSPSQPSSPRKSENGDVRGKDNDGDGRPETTYVEGYTRKDGVRVKGHYRAKR